MVPFALTDQRILSIPTERTMCSRQEQDLSCTCGVDSPLKKGSISDPQISGFEIGVDESTLELDGAVISGALSNNPLAYQIVESALDEAKLDASKAPGSVILNVFCDPWSGIIKHLVHLLDKVFVFKHTPGCCLGPAYTGQPFIVFPS